MASAIHGPLAELHLHLYGCLPPRAIFERLLAFHAHLDLTRYEHAFEAAYGAPSPLGAIVDDHRAGDPGAALRFDELFVFGDRDAGNFAKFQAKFNLISALLAARWSEETLLRVGRSRDELVDEEVELFTEMVCAEQRRNGVAYAEQRHLASHAAEYEGWPKLLGAIRRGIARAGMGEGAVRVAPSLPRGDPWGQWESIRAIAIAEGGEIVTGIDFCHVEEGHPPRDKAAFFAAVRDHNERHPERALAVLYHVGESFTDKSLESAIRWVDEAAELGAHRLGHAIALGIDPAAFGPHTRREPARERIDQLRYDLAHADGLERRGVIVDRAAAAEEIRRLEATEEDALVVHKYDAARLDEVRRRQDFAMDRVKSAGAVIEVCPTSNLRIGGIRDPAHHPLRRFLAAGMRVVIASDDPGIFGTSLRDELAWAERDAGLSAEEIAALADAAWDARSEVLTGREPARR